MVRFACFLSHSSCHKSKKGMPQSASSMDLTPHVSFQEEPVKPSAYNDNNLLTSSSEQVITPSSQEDCRKSDLVSKHSSDGSKMFSQMVHLKKSQSLGSVLDKTRGFSGDGVSDDDGIDQEFSFDNFRGNNMRKDHDSSASTDSAELQDQNTAANTGDQNQDNELAGSFELVADPGCHESIFSIGNQPFEGEHQRHSIGEHFSDLVADSIHSSPNTLPIFAKSRSAVNLRVDTTNSIEGSVTHEFTGPRSRSFKDISPLHGARGEFLNGEEAHHSERTFQKRTTDGYSHNMPDERGSSGPSVSKEECQFSNTSGFNELDEQERDDKYSNEKYKFDNQSVDAYQPQNYDDLRNEWKEAEGDVAERKKDFQQDSSILNLDHLTSEEFTIRRIENWISQIDFHACSDIPECGESSHSVPKKDSLVLKKGPHVVAGVAGSRHDSSNLGMEVAYNYISSLSSTSSSAQMSNLGLVALPFLGAFASLRTLNLSGNGIVRITSGVLPRGLHVLNLSKNNISTIEGLRDLSRLRVLYLNYNRIVRIGHGLAYCSSLKELYLAGNKISEVEGLHRLLKLNALDLSFNKISTAKCLGQLAANYGSLQAIHLEGNPAQRNVGDEQLKKHLLSLLPRLVYYNKQIIRSGSLKDIVAHSQQSLTSHQFERVTRIDQKHPRRANHGSAIHGSTSSNHGRASPVMSGRGKQSKSRHLQLPPPGPKATHHQPRTWSLEPRNPIRRSLSEGVL